MPTIRRRCSVLALIASLLGWPAPAAADAPGDRERAVCGWREPLAFWMWRRAAGSPNPDALAGLRGVEPVSFRTGDGRTLRGYKLAAAPPARGYLLFAQGNAMLADVVAELEAFRERGLDVHVFDYRGYGTSEGRSRLHAIVLDYGELIEHLGATPAYARGKRYLYGTSFGGIVLINAAAGRPAAYDALVVDSSPARISDLGCPSRDYDPASKVPADARRLMALSGSADTVITAAQARDLLAAVAARGGVARELPSFPHPFMEGLARRGERFRLVADFLDRH